MIRNLFIFLATFGFGALIALATRAALHEPPAPVSQHSAKEHAAMVSNPLMGASEVAPSNPASQPGVIAPKFKATEPTAGSEHQGHGAMASAAAAKPEPVNSVCAICGMKVDPSLPTLEYQGKKIGFGCKMCAPKFKADPEKYGPVYLKNEVIKR